MPVLRKELVVDLGRLSILLIKYIQYLIKLRGFSREIIHNQSTHIYVVHAGDITDCLIY